MMILTKEFFLCGAGESNLHASSQTLAPKKEFVLSAVHVCISACECVCVLCEYVFVCVYLCVCVFRPEANSKFLL